MLARKNDSEIKNFMSTISKDLTKKILDYVDLKEAHKFSFSSRHLFFTLNHDKYLEKRIDFVLKFNSVIEKALVGIDTYLKHDSDLPYECQGIDARISEYTSFPKGYRRARCFQDILIDENNPIPSRLLALYTLLHEFNGKNLKSRVQRELIPNFGVNFLKMLESYLRDQFTQDKISIFQKKLLDTIHDKTNNGALPDFQFDYREDDFSKGFMRRHIVSIFEDKKPSRCCVS